MFTRCHKLNIFKDKEEELRKKKKYEEKKDKKNNERTLRASFNCDWSDCTSKV
jgi:hypothetical protein